jgi:glucokinase
MIKFRMYSKIYDKAKAQHDRSEDYEIAEIAKEQSKLKGQIIGAGIGLGISALSKKVREINRKKPEASGESEENRSRDS